MQLKAGLTMLDHTNSAHQNDRLVRKPEVRSRTSMSDSTIYRREKEGRFPQRIRLTERTTVWRESDLREWLADPEGYRQGGA